MRGEYDVQNMLIAQTKGSPKNHQQQALKVA
jgi:hypothetical protein